MPDSGAGAGAGEGDGVAGVDVERVTAWFEVEIESVQPPLTFSQIPGGHSNLTFRVQDAGGSLYVLRRPPLGAVLATAHDMAREHRTISSLASTDVPVPPALGLCEDETVNDAPFYVMDFVEGLVLVDAKTTAESFDETTRARVGASVIEVLAALHSVDPDTVGLGDLGRREAYLERQLKRWRGQWEKTKTRELPEMDEVHALLTARVPEQMSSGIVHGDYRLGNMLVDSEGRIAAVLDWELCTLGDPLADLGYLLNSWTDPGDDALSPVGDAMLPTAAGGFPSREEMSARYFELTGREACDVGYYRAFQYWRLAAIIEGVLARYLKGVMGRKVNTDVFRRQVDAVAQSALDLLRS